MPTEMKNSPSSRPLNGSMHASISWRYSESASSTPARKAPSVIDRPTLVMSRAVPITTSRAQPVKISWICAFATRRSTGRSRWRPPTMTRPIMPKASSTSTRGWSAASDSRAIISGITASSGITAMSWNSEIANAERPWRVVSWPRSASNWSTKGVEFIDSTTPTTTAAARPRPKA